MQGASQSQQQQQSSQHNTPQQQQHQQQQQQTSSRTSTIDVPVRILVPSESVGAIIGKGGQTIRALTQQTRAKVDVYRGDPLAQPPALQEKVITIRGQPENCINACREILKVMRHDAENKGKSAQQAQEIPLKVLAHNDYIGRIIGKQGNIINSIKQDTNTQVSVSSINDMSMNVERVITVKGELENMIKALEIIHTKIKSAFENDTKTYGAQAIMMGGIPPIPLIPPHFAYAAVQGLTTNAHQAPTRYTQASSLGTSPSTYGAFYPPLIPAYNPAVAAANMMPPQASNSGSNGTPQQQMTPNNGAQSIEYSPDMETVRLFIPNVAVGAIIGTKGSFIKNIIKLSGASVKITPMSPEESKEAQEREVVIMGSPESQWKAQYYIYEKIRQERFASDENFKLKSEIDVPSTLVGRIIGKSGKNVRELQRSTGAIIKLPEDSSDTSQTSNASSLQGPTSTQVIVSIIGSFNSSQCAQRRIQALVAQSRGGATAALYRAATQSLSHYAAATPYQTLQPLINPHHHHHHQQQQQQQHYSNSNHNSNRMNGKNRRNNYQQQQNGSHYDQQNEHEEHEIQSSNEQQQQQ